MFKVPAPPEPRSARRPPSSGVRNPATVNTPSQSSSARIGSARPRRYQDDWTAPQDIEDGDFVRYELDSFEMLKIKQLALTLSRPAEALPIDSTADLDKASRHKIMKAQVLLTGGRRPGSNANDFVIYKNNYFRKYAPTIDTGKLNLSTWLHDLRALRLHPYVLKLRNLGVTDVSGLLDAWFKHSKQNTQLTMTNAHTGLRGFFSDIFGKGAYVDINQCQVLYERLNDRKHSTMDYAPAMAKLQLLIADVNPSNWESYARLFFSGAYSFIDDSDFVSAHELSAVISVFETLLNETEATLVEVPPRIGCAALWQTVRFCKDDAVELANRQSRDRMLLKPEVVAMLPPTGVLQQLLTCGLYASTVAEHASRGESVARLKKQAERNALLSKISRMRLPVEELRKAQSDSAALKATQSRPSADDEYELPE